MTQNLFLKQQQLFAELSGASAAAGVDVVDVVDVDDVAEVDVDVDVVVVSCSSFPCSPWCCYRQAW